MTHFRSEYPQAANIAGIARKKLNSAAAGRERPASIPPRIVAADRDVPGKTAAKICAQPMPNACFQVIRSIRRVVTLAGINSIRIIAIPPTRSATATTVALPRFLSIQSWTRNPTTNTGNVADTITSNATDTNPTGADRHTRLSVRGVCEKLPRARVQKGGVAVAVGAE